MGTQTAELAKPEEVRVSLAIPTPILNVIDRSLANVIKKNLREIIAETNTAIERGVKEDDAALQANAVVDEGRKAIKIVNEVRLQFTRPIDAGKKQLIEEVRKMLAPLEGATNKLNTMTIEREQRIRAEQERIEQENERRKQEADAKRRAEEERRRNISLGKGGNGDFTPVEPEPVAPIVTTAGMRSTTRIKSIVDNEKIRKAIDEDGVRDIAGVSIFQVWQFEIVDSKAVPKQYRKDIRG
jgi:hypothetical protein